MTKFIIQFLMVFFVYPIVLSQTIYTFGTPGSYANPGWTSASNLTSTNQVLNYQTNLGMVSSNDIPAGNRYLNSQRTSYTSPNINTTCDNASTVTVTFGIDYDLENGYDWGYFQYSLNGGTTWLNPVGVSAFNNLSGSNLSGFPPLTAWVNNNSNRNGWTNFGTANYSLILPSSTTTRFRFIFASDGSTNSYITGATTYDYYFDVTNFDIVCNVVLPVTLSSFTGENNPKKNENLLQWRTETEQNNDYFIVQWTTDPESDEWTSLANINGADNSDSPSNYEFNHNAYTPNKINYYRLVQVDNNEVLQMYKEYVAIDNAKNTIRRLEKVINLLGQEVDDSYKGIVIHIYNDGTTLKTYNP